MKQIMCFTLLVSFLVFSQNLPSKILPDSNLYPKCDQTDLDTFKERLTYVFDHNLGDAGKKDKDYVLALVFGQTAEKSGKYADVNGERKCQALKAFCKLNEDFELSQKVGSYVPSGFDAAFFIANFTPTLDLDKYSKVNPGTKNYDSFFRVSTGYLSPYPNSKTVSLYVGEGVCMKPFGHDSEKK